MTRRSAPHPWTAIARRLVQTILITIIVAFIWAAAVVDLPQHMAGFTSFMIAVWALCVIVNWTHG